MNMYWCHLCGKETDTCHAGIHPNTDTAHIVGSVTDCPCH